VFKDKFEINKADCAKVALFNENVANEKKKNT